MKKVLKLSVFTAAFALLAVGCEKVQEGFMSHGIRYKDMDIFCIRGATLTLSDRIEGDGSTPPFQFKMLNLRDAETGQPAPQEFFTEYEVKVFKKGMVFNAATDTTVALLDAKRETVNVRPFEFNPKSGQLAFNKASANLPLGVYAFDVEFTNPNGTRVFENIARINVVDPTVDDVFEITYQAMTGSDASEVFSPAQPVPQLTCTKVSNEGARVILKIVDKHGNPWNPAAGEIVKRGDRPTIENHVKFNPVIMTDTAMICDFEVAPFPLTTYHDGVTDWTYLQYYRIPMRFASMDGFPNHNINPVWGFRVKMEGTYVVEIKLPVVTRVSSGGPAPGGA